MQRDLETPRSVYSFAADPDVPFETAVGDAHVPINTIPRGARPLAAAEGIDYIDSSPLGPYIEGTVDPIGRR